MNMGTKTYRFARLFSDESKLTVLDSDGKGEDMGNGQRSTVGISDSHCKILK